MRALILGDAAPRLRLQLANYGVRHHRNPGLSDEEPTEHTVLLRAGTVWFKLILVILPHPWSRFGLPPVCCFPRRRFPFLSHLATRAQWGKSTLPITQSEAIIRLLGLNSPEVRGGQSELTWISQSFSYRLVPAAHSEARLLPRNRSQ